MRYSFSWVFYSHMHLSCNSHAHKWTETGINSLFAPTARLNYDIANLSQKQAL